MSHVTKFSCDKIHKIINLMKCDSNAGITSPKLVTPKYPHWEEAIAVYTSKKQVNGQVHPPPPQVALPTPAFSADQSATSSVTYQPHFDHWCQRLKSPMKHVNEPQVSITYKGPCLSYTRDSGPHVRVTSPAPRIKDRRRNNQYNVYQS